jgi:hypothetical protein
MIDSGAFSVSNSGRNISIEEYARYLRSIPSDMNYRAFQLDVVNMPEKTYEWYCRQRDMGLNVIPIFQIGGDLKLLEALYQDSDLVGFAGGRMNISYTVEMMGLVGSRKAHILGVTKPSSLQRLKPWSSDSVSWMAGGMWGFVRLWDTKVQEFKLWYYAKHPEKLDEYVPLLKNLGLTREDGARLTKFREGTVIQENTKQVLRMHRMIDMWSWLAYGRELFDRQNTRVFLAAKPESVKEIILAYEASNRRGICKITQV